MTTKKRTSGPTLRLILGDQLNLQHRWFSEIDDATIYVLMEVRQETDYVLHHAQKILAIFHRDLGQTLTPQHPAYQVPRGLARKVGCATVGSSGQGWRG